MGRRWARGLLVVLVAACARSPKTAAGLDAGASDDPLRAAFVEDVEAALRDAGQAQIRYDRSQFRIAYGPPDAGAEINLANLFAEWRGTADKDGFITRMIAPMGDELPHRFEEAALHLMPVVRARVFFDYSKYRGVPGGEDLMPFRPLGNGLGAGLAFDSDRGMAFLGAHQLRTWNVSFDQAFEVGLKNLRAHSSARFKRIARGVFASPWEDNYDTSRALLPELFAVLQVKGRPVVTLPNRDTVLVAGSDDPDALRTLASLTRTALEAPRRVSGAPLVLTHGQWGPFLPEGDRELVDAYRELQLKALGSDYQDQKEQIDEANQRSGLDVFVASYGLMKDEGGSWTSFCAWSHGVDTLLPHAQFVVFMDADAARPPAVHPVAVAPWEEAQRLVGDRMKPEGLEPERYHVTGFPTPAEVRALGFAPEFARLKPKAH